MPNLLLYTLIIGFIILVSQLFLYQRLNNNRRSNFCLGNGGKAAMAVYGVNRGNIETYLMDPSAPTPSPAPTQLPDPTYILGEQIDDSSGYDTQISAGVTLDSITGASITGAIYEHSNGEDLAIHDSAESKYYKVTLEDSAKESSANNLHFESYLSLIPAAAIAHKFVLD
jgi:hypothetical protein